MSGLLLLGTAAGCLDLEPTPGDPLAADASIPVDASTDSRDPNWILDADLSDAALGTCVNACIDQASDTPESAARFRALSQCSVAAPGNPDLCASACTPGAVMEEPSTCPMPGSFAEAPACNACVKNLCCPLITACFNDLDCFPIGMCANRCL
jgi:hypothetical protein